MFVLHPPSLQDTVIRFVSSSAEYVKFVVECASVASHFSQVCFVLSISSTWKVCATVLPDVLEYTAVHGVH